MSVDVIGVSHIVSCQFYTNLNQQYLDEYVAFCSKLRIYAAGFNFRQFETHLISSVQMNIIERSAVHN